MQRYMMKESEQGNICDGVRLKNIKVMALCLRRIRFVLCKEERKKIKSETLCIKRC